MKKILMAVLLCIPAILLTGCVTETTSYSQSYGNGYPYTNTYYGSGYYGSGYYGSGYYGGYGAGRVARAAAWGNYYNNHNWYGTNRYYGRNWHGTSWRGGSWNRAAFHGGARRGGFHGGGRRR